MENKHNTWWKGRGLYSSTIIKMTILVFDATLPSEIQKKIPVCSSQKQLSQDPERIFANRRILPR